MRESPATYRILDLDETERPRERLAKIGAGALSNAELLAILLRTGVPGENAVEVGQRLLDKLDGIVGLHHAPFEELCNQKGVGPAKAAQVKAAIELGSRMATFHPDERSAIHCPADAAALVVHEMSLLTQEELRVFLLDTRNKVIKIQMVYKGSLNSSQVRIAEVFKEAIRSSAASIIVVHNHPSGDPSPSPDDVAITRALVSAGKLLDIQCLDHLVIGGGRFVSLKDRNLGFG